jgi:asparagine synthase (glutamine-hydrolysing)
VDGWFHSAMGGHLSDLLLDSNSLMFKLLKVEPVRKLLDDHQAGLQDNHKLLFSLVMLEQWMRGVNTSPATNL